jgi:hypothetical protein
MDGSSSDSEPDYKAIITFAKHAHGRAKNTEEIMENLTLNKTEERYVVPAIAAGWKSIISWILDNSVTG